MAWRRLLAHRRGDLTAQVVLDHLGVGDLDEQHQPASLVVILEVDHQRVGPGVVEVRFGQPLPSARGID